MQRHAALLLTVSSFVFAVLAHGCTDPTITDDECKNDSCEEEETTTCQTSEECAVSKTCLLGSCVEPPACDTTDDCPDGQCVNGRCLGDRAPSTNNGTNNGTTTGSNGATNGETNNEDWSLRLCHSETDEGDDGLLERTRDHEYDDEGLHVAVENRDQQVDGFNYRETYTYDADGLRIRTDRDVGFDDSVDVRTTYEYDDGGRLTESREDRDVDGTIDSTTENTYDADGKRIRERIIWPGNEVHRVREFIYDANGYLSEETTDFDDDGVDSRTFREHDADGKLLEIRYDFDADGTIDMQVAEIYEDGRRVRTEKDEDGDGTLDEVTSYEYGPGGREVMRITETATGQPISSQSTSYTDMEKGIDVDRESDRDGDGTIDQTSLSNWRYHPSCEL